MAATWPPAIHDDVKAKIDEMLVTLGLKANFSDVEAKISRTGAVAGGAVVVGADLQTLQMGPVPGTGGGSGSTASQYQTEAQSFTLSADRIDKTLDCAFTTDGVVTLPMGDVLSLSAWPLGRSAHVIKNGSGNIAFVGGTGTGTSSVPAVRNTVTTKAVQPNAASVAYAMLNPTTATDDVLFRFISVALTAATWEIPAGWEQLTLPTTFNAANGEASSGPSGAGTYVFMKRTVTGNLAGTSDAFRISSYASTPPMVAATVAVRNADKTNPIAVLTSKITFSQSTAAITAPASPVSNSYLEIGGVQSSSGGTVDGLHTTTDPVTILANLRSTDETTGTSPAAANTRLAIGANPNAVGAGVATGARQFSGGYGSGFSILVNPVTGSSAKVRSLDNALRIISQDASAVVTRTGLNEWHVTGTVVV